MTRRPLVKVFGERNCGTTVAESMLREAGTVDVLASTAPARVRRMAVRSGARELVLDLWDSTSRRSTLGWKHAYLDDTTVRRMTDRGVNAIAMTKHPLSWLVSLRRRPYHLLTGPDPQELTCQYLRRERLPQAATALIDVWRVKTERYLELQDRGVLSLVRFEDFVVAPAEVLAAAFAQRGVAVAGLKDAPRSVKNDARTTDDIQAEYAAERWRQAALDWDLDQVARLDRALLAALRYDP